MPRPKGERKFKRLCPSERLAMLPVGRKFKTAEAALAMDVTFSYARRILIRFEKASKVKRIKDVYRYGGGEFMALAWIVSEA